MERVLIIEDESLASDKLKMLLNRLRPEMKICAILTTVRDSVKWLGNNDVDLIFLDINLADDISFKIFDQIEVNVPIIFTTAYDQYAIRAFKQNSLDYVLKPVTEYELAQSLQKYDRYLGNRADYSTQIQSLIHLFSQSNNKRSRVLISYGGKNKSIPINEVAYFYAFERGVYLMSFDGKTYLTDDLMEDLEKSVESKIFFRVNRKFLVNINAIQEINKYSSRRLKIELKPAPKFDAIVPAEKITAFKQWLNS